MNYHSNDAEREQRAGKSYAVASIAIGIVVLILAVVWIVQMTGFRPRPQDTIVAPSARPPAAVIITEPKVDKIQDRLEAPAPAPVPEAPAAELKPAVDLPPDVPAVDAAPALDTAAPGYSCGPYGCTNDAAVAAATKAQQAVSVPPVPSPIEPTEVVAPAAPEHQPKLLKMLDHRRKRDHLRITHHNTTLGRMSPGLARVMAEGAGRVAGCQGDCSLPAMFCRASARGAGLIR